MTHSRNFKTIKSLLSIQFPASQIHKKEMILKAIRVFSELNPIEVAEVADLIGYMEDTRKTV